MHFTTSPLCWGMSLLVLMKDWPGIAEFLSFVPSITMGRCRTVLVVSQKPESKDGVWMFGSCLLFCIILPKILFFIFFLHLGDYFVKKVVFPCPDIPICQKEAWICTLRVLRNVLEWKLEFVGHDQWKEVSARILPPLCCFRVHDLPRAQYSS